MNPSLHAEYINNLIEIKNICLFFNIEFIEEINFQILNMSRVLKKGGNLIFSTAVTRHEPTLAFNAHRIYTIDMIRELCSGLECVNEKFYSINLKKYCDLDQVTNKINDWDVYFGNWRKT